ncbi:nuclear transport factor 2 family protein, partial [Klebsiella pneumoniae]|nr:nuclear transport factor 2 family protein [Klebsiella pneumoniae]
MTTYDRAELEAAYADFAALQQTQDWNAICDRLYTDDAVYVEHALGTFEGREAIRAWLVPCMAPLVGWEYPTTWVAYGEDFVVLG